MQNRYLMTVSDARTKLPVVDGHKYDNLYYIRLMLKSETELGWWARRQFIKNLHKTGLSTYIPRVTSDRYRIITVTHWVDSGTI